MKQEELMRKVKACRSPEELAQLADELNYPLDPEQTKSLYARMHENGELADEELDSVSGGGCQIPVNGKQYTMVSSGLKCFTGKFKDGMRPATGGWYRIPIREDHNTWRGAWAQFPGVFAGPEVCGWCIHLEFAEDGSGYCGVEHD